MKKIPLSVVLMAHNEEETIEKEVKSYYREIVKKIPGSEMIIVDDGNTDNTGNILHRLTKKLPLVIIPAVKKIGYARSLRLSLEKARGELVFFADAGGKHNPKDYWRLYREVKKYGMIIGYKKNRQDAWYRLLLAWGLNTLVNLYFGVRFKDIDCGYKLMSDETKKAILSEQWILKDNISLEIVLRAAYQGFKVKELPIKHFSRVGESRGMPTKKIPKVIFTLLFTFPKIKKELQLLKVTNSQESMMEGYNNLFPTNKYREIWEGKISSVYKLPKYLKIINNFLTQISKNQSVLEIGCGDGEIAEALLKNTKLPISNYTATELTEGGVKTAKRTLQKFKTAKIYQADATKLPFKNKSFDLVFSFDVMHHVNDPELMAQEIVRVGKRRILLIEANGLSLARRFAEKQKKYIQMSEKSYFPWQYSKYFSLPRVKEFRIRPFLFMFPHCPNILISLNIFISELLEKIPLLNWQCSGVIIEVQLKK